MKWSSQVVLVLFACLVRQNETKVFDKCELKEVFSQHFPKEQIDDCKFLVLELRALHLLL